MTLLCFLFCHRVHRFPEKLPEIDFAYYRGRLTSPAIVDEYEKAVSLIAHYLFYI